MYLQYIHTFFGKTAFVTVSLIEKNKKFYLVCKGNLIYLLCIYVEISF